MKEGEKGKGLTERFVYDFEMGQMFAVFKPSLILHYVFVSMYPPHPILVVVTGGWKGEEPDETFGDKLLVGRPLPDFYIL